MSTIQQNECPYKRISALAAEYSMTPANVRLILKEIESCNRYRNRWITLNDYGVKLVNVLVVEDYLRNRGAIKSGLSKHLPPYDPATVRYERGEADVHSGLRQAVGGD